MTVYELYYKFKLLYNKNNESKEINIPIEHFVILYNKEGESWLADYIRTHKHNSEIFKINELISSDVELKEISKNRERAEYSLPEDFFDIIPGTIVSNVSNCTGKIFNRLYKNEDLNSVLSNQFLKPSSKWQRGVARLANNKVTIYLNDFSVSSTFISYYKKLKPIDVAGYITINNTASSDEGTTYSDFIANEILDRVVTEVHREFSDQLAFQLSKDREI